jgi:hypothetical protein
MQKQPDKPRLWCVFNSDTGHWRMVNYEKHSAAVNASTAYTHGYEVHEMLSRSDVEQIIRETREAATMRERERCVAVCSRIYEYGGTPSLDEWPRMREAIESGIQPGEGGE